MAGQHISRCTSQKVVEAILQQSSAQFRALRVGINKPFFIGSASKGSQQTARTIDCAAPLHDFIVRPHFAAVATSDVLGRSFIVSHVLFPVLIVQLRAARFNAATHDIEGRHSPLGFAPVLPECGMFIGAGILPAPCFVRINALCHGQSDLSTFLSWDNPNGAGQRAARRNVDRGSRTS